jgi:hypothetical protein
MNNDNYQRGNNNAVASSLPIITLWMLKLSFSFKKENSVRWIFWNLTLVR